MLIFVLVSIVRRLWTIRNAVRRIIASLIQHLKKLQNNHLDKIRGRIIFRSVSLIIRMLFSPPPCTECHHSFFQVIGLYPIISNEAFAENCQVLSGIVLNAHEINGELAFCFFASSRP